MPLVDNLSVLVTANAKQFTATMNGVVQTTERTQSALERISNVAKKGGALLAASFAGAAISAVAFTAGVKRLGDALQEYGNDVPATTVKAFAKMDQAMEESKKAMLIFAGEALSKASDGFIMLNKSVSDSLTNSKAVTKLMEGMNYVFAILGETIKSVANILNVIVNGFEVLFKTVEMASYAMDDFFSGVPEHAAAINKLTGEIVALGDDSKAALSDAFDYNRFVTAIEDVYKMANERERERQKILAEGGGAAVAWEARVVEAMRKREVEQRKAMDLTSLQTEVLRRTLTDQTAFMYEVEAERTKLAQKSAEERLSNALWAATQEEQIAAMKRQNIQSIAMQEAQDSAQMQALWESSWRGKAEILGGIIGGFAVLMETNSKKMFKVGKAAAMADAVISALLAANRAYSAMAGIPYVGPALGAAAAASALLAGYANVNKIKAMQYGGGGGSSPGGGSAVSTPSVDAAAPGGGGPSSQSNVNVTLIGDRFSDSQVRGLVGRINGALDDNSKIKVKTGFRG